MSQHVRGTTFDCSGQIEASENGVPIISLVGWTGRCQIRAADGDLMAEATFTWLDASQRLCRVHVDDTSGWPLGEASIDIRLTSPGDSVVSTAATSFTVVRGVTQ